MEEAPGVGESQPLEAVTDEDPPNNISNVVMNRSEKSVGGSDGDGAPKVADTATRAAPPRGAAGSPLCSAGETMTISSSSAAAADAVLVLLLPTFAAGSSYTAYWSYFVMSYGERAKQENS